MSEQKFTTVLLVVVALSGWACDHIADDRSDESYDLSIRTDQNVYEKIPPFAVTLTIENVGRDEVYLLCGGAFGLEEWVDGKLNRSAPGIQLECGGIDTVAHGGEFVRQKIFDDSRLDGGPVPAPTAIVKYRFVVGVYQDAHGHTLVAPERRRSNEFEVRSKSSGGPD